MIRAFTMVELLVVFALISILAGAGVGVSQQAGRRQRVLAAAENLAGALKTARANALAGKKDTATCGSNFLDGWRVAVLTNGYTLEGVCGAVFFSKTTTYPMAVTNSPTPTVLFKPLGLGATPATTITVSGSGVTQTVQVTGSGEVK